MKHKRSEGVKRVCILLSILLTLSWITFVIVGTEGDFYRVIPAEYKLEPSSRGGRGLAERLGREQGEFKDSLGILKATPERVLIKPEQRLFKWPLLWVSLGGLLFAFFIPQVIRLVAYWIIDGFRKDKITA